MAKIFPLSVPVVFLTWNT